MASFFFQISLFTAEQIRGTRVGVHSAYLLSRSLSDRSQSTGILSASAILLAVSVNGSSRPSSQSRITLLRFRCWQPGPLGTCTPPVVIDAASCQSSCRFKHHGIARQKEGPGRPPRRPGPPVAVIATRMQTYAALAPAARLWSHRVLILAGQGLLSICAPWHSRVSKQEAARYVLERDRCCCRAEGTTHARFRRKCQC